MTVSPAEPEGAPKIIFASLDAAIAREMEPRFAAAGCAVVSNSSAFRMTAECAPGHSRGQRRPPAPDRGAALAPGVRRLHGHQSQLLHHRPGHGPQAHRGALRHRADLRHHHAGGQRAPAIPASPPWTSSATWCPTSAAKKRRWKPRRSSCSASSSGHAVEPLAAGITAHCNRVAVVDGHTECVSIKLRKQSHAAKRFWPPGLSSVRSPARDLPTAPAIPVEWAPQPDRPQPRLDRNRGNGMAVTVGRLRPCSLLDWKFTAALAQHHSRRCRRCHPQRRTAGQPGQA